MNRYKVVIWDWNGTLADDAETSLLATNDILKAYGKAPIDMAQYYEYIDTPISRFYEHLFDLNEVPMSVIAPAFQAGYAKYFEGLHDGVPELLRAVADQSVRQVVLSSGNQKVIERDMERLGIRPYFEAVLGAEDLLAGSKTDRGKAWVEAQNITPADMVLIGDTLHDYETAQILGTDCILCAIGHQSERDLRTAGVPVVTAFSQLKDLLLEPAAVS